MQDVHSNTTRHTNPDAITGAPGSHPGGTAVGAASGAAAGAAIGSLGGPIGAIIGGVAGAAVGGYTGHAIGEWNDPSDLTYWREEHKRRPYYSASSDFDRDLEPAYRYGSNMGMEDARSSSGSVSRSFDSVADTAQQDWDQVRGNSRYSFDEARPAISDAYNRKVSVSSTSAGPTSNLSDGDKLSH